MMEGTETTIEQIYKKLQSTSDIQANLEKQHNQIISDLIIEANKQDDKKPLLSAQRELETKMNIEKDKYEELMLDLSLLKKSTKALNISGDSWNNNEEKASDEVNYHQSKNLNSFEDSVDTRTSLLNIDSSKQGSKSGEEISNFNSILSSPSIEQYNNSVPEEIYGDYNHILDLAQQSSMITIDQPELFLDLGFSSHQTTASASRMTTTAAAAAAATAAAVTDTISITEPEHKVDMLEIPGKGRCYVYLARYSYDPFQQSLNDNPEYELPLMGGDYVLIWGDTDEDGYFEGELLDGRKGLLPSNFVERLSGEDLLEFHSSVVLANEAVEEEEEYSTMVPVNLPSELPFSPERNVPHIYEEESHLLNATYLTPDEEMHDPIMPSEHQQVHHQQPIVPGSPTTDMAGSSVPAPRHLTLERQLNKSILISWTPPETYFTQIEMYHVYVDGFLRTTVKAADKTKALVEGVDNSRPHRISVRSVLVNRKTSKDAACTMIIGKDAPLGPSCVKASSVTSHSAIISWLPSNSNFQHTVCINNVEVRTLKPGVFKHTITGLSPNTHYKVTVRAKNIKASPYVDEKSLTKLLEKLSAHTEFRTLNKALPDPPMDVRVDGGPQDGTILVTWIPVPLNIGQNNNKQTPVTGYAVFADGKRVTDVDSPTSDHALIDLGCIGHFNPKLITVRSKSRDLLSTDSTAVTIQSNRQSRRTSKIGPDNRHKYTSNVNNMRNNRKITKTIRDSSGQLIIDQEEDNLSDKEMYARNVPAIEITRESPSEFDQYSDDEYEMPKKASMNRYYHRRKQSRFGTNKDGSRIFVALFDYDPLTMSPNPEACGDELSFKEGQLIKIIGEKDSDGFYLGECNGKNGYVPCNMVSEVQVDDDQFLQDMVTTNKDDTNRRRKATRYVNKERWNDIYSNTPTRKMIALYDYDPQELSPNVDAEVELKFQTGDVIYIYGEMDDDGFYLAELRGQRGLVPSNFLTEASTSSDLKQKINRQQTHHQHQQQTYVPSGASGPPPPPRENRNKVNEGLKIESKPPLGGMMQALTGHKFGGGGSSGGAGAAVATSAADAHPASQSTINLDKIPGLDDFDDPPSLYTPTRAGAPTAFGQKSATASGSGASKPPGTEEGGLLGAVTGGLSQGITGLATGGVSGITGKLGDLAGSATNAGGGILSSGKGLFKKFGF